MMMMETAVFISGLLYWCSSALSVMCAGMNAGIRRWSISEKNV